MSAPRQGARPIGARFASRRESRCAIHDPRLFFCIRLVMEAFTDGQPSLLLRVRRESEPGSVDVLACRAKWKHSRPEPQLDAGDLVGVRAIEPEIPTREAEAKRAARTKPLVVPLGSRADVQLQASGTLEAMA